MAVNQDIKSHATYSVLSGRLHDDAMRELIYRELPMALTILWLDRHGPIAKHSDGYLRFQCPRCSELRATVNPKYNLAHCFSCGENFNNFDLMMLQGHDFLPAVEILRSWLDE